MSKLILLWCLEPCAAEAAIPDAREDTPKLHACQCWQETGSLSGDVKLTVVIVNFRSKEVLIPCLDSLMNQVNSPAFDVIVVDNSSELDASIQTSYPRVRVLNPERNLGYAEGNNLGFAATEAEFILALNPDTVLPPNCLGQAVDLLESRPAYGSLAAKLMGMDGNRQRSMRNFPNPGNIWFEATGLARIFKNSPRPNYRANDFDYATEGPAPQAMGTFLLFRRAALEDVGASTNPFDAQFPIFFNEVDLQFRLKNEGWPCLYAPTIEVRHVGGFSTKQLKPEMIWESHRSLIRYLKKHYPEKNLVLLNLFVWLGAFVRAKGYRGHFGP